MRVLHAGCKVNIYLRILGRRKDGMHDLQSLFYPLREPGDKLYITEAAPGTGLSLRCSDPSLEGQQNILQRTYDIFAAHIGQFPDLHVFLEKKIPQGAGLGGGSSDAASFLLFLQEKYAPGVETQADLRTLACSLGADVSFFLQNSPAWVEGFGDIVTPVCVDLRGLKPLIVCPEIYVSTKEAYALWDDNQHAADPHPVQHWLLTSKKREYKYFCPVNDLLLWNSFEKVVFKKYSDLYKLKIELLKTGSAATVLSGSGSALFCLFRNESALRAARSFLIQEKISFFG